MSCISLLNLTVMSLFINDCNIHQPVLQIYFIGEWARDLILDPASATEACNWAALRMRCSVKSSYATSYQLTFNTISFPSLAWETALIKLNFITASGTHLYSDQLVNHPLNAQNKFNTFSLLYKRCNSAQQAWKLFII